MPTHADLAIATAPKICMPNHTDVAISALALVDHFDALDLAEKHPCKTRNMLASIPISISGSPILLTSCWLVLHWMTRFGMLAQCLRKILSLSLLQIVI